MASTFATLEDRLQQAVFARLANAEASLDGGEPFPVIFDSPYVEGFGGMATRKPQALAPSASVEAITSSSLLVIKGITYRVTSPQPDGLGFTNLMLQRQP